MIVSVANGYDEQFYIGFFPYPPEGDEFTGEGLGERKIIFPDLKPMKLI